MESSSNEGDGPDEYGFCDGHYFFGLCLRQNRFLNLRKAPGLENYLKNTSEFRAHLEECSKWDVSTSNSQTFVSDDFGS